MSKEAVQIKLIKLDIRNTMKMQTCKPSERICSITPVHTQIPRRASKRSSFAATCNGYVLFVRPQKPALGAFTSSDVSLAGAVDGKRMMMMMMSTWTCATGRFRKFWSLHVKEGAEQDVHFYCRMSRTFFTAQMLVSLALHLSPNPWSTSMHKRRRRL